MKKVPDGNVWLTPRNYGMPGPSCLRLLVHCIRLAASRAACTAGNNSAIKTAMIAITTSSSMSVKPC